MNVFKSVAATCVLAITWPTAAQAEQVCGKGYIIQIVDADLVPNTYSSAWASEKNGPAMTVYFLDGDKVSEATILYDLKDGQGQNMAAQRFARMEASLRAAMLSRAYVELTDTTNQKCRYYPQRYRLKTCAQAGCK